MLDTECRCSSYVCRICMSWEGETHLVYCSHYVQWGYVVISTPDGVLDHEEAIRRNVGGQVLGYFH